MGSGSDGAVFRYDGVSWASLFQVSGAGGVQSMVSYEEWDEAAGASVPRLMLGCGFSGGEARVYRWDGSALSDLHGCREPRIEAMAVYRDRLYVATSDVAESPQGRILGYDGRSAAGRWSELAWLRDNYVAGWAVFDELLICGSGRNGRIWAFDGDSLVEIYSIDGLDECVEPLRGMEVAGGRLYAGHLHPSQGVALLSKLPIAELADGGAMDRLEAARLGWFTSSVVGGDQRPSVLACYDGAVYLGTDAAGSTAIYRQDAALRQGLGVVESSFFDGGLPSVPKLLHSLVVSHQPLQLGQRLEVGYALSDLEGFREGDCSGLVWTALGVSDGMGSTSAFLSFPTASVARWVAFRIRLVGNGDSDSPVLAGIALEYAPLPDVKRRWSFDVVCEGVAGAPLRLLDGSLEEKTGSELSELLWGICGAGPASFEDVDGLPYQVWIEGLEERLSDAPQGRGAQTVADCRLLEC
ncbi:MAG TPA: hypothetical protein VHS28_03920 [Chloroflexota bacterium]|nr:hypothetical protein [Chloroflexota bacterium]